MKFNYLNNQLVEIVLESRVNTLVNLRKIERVIFNEVDAPANYRVYIVFQSGDTSNFQFDTREQAIHLYNDITSALISYTNTDEEKELVKKELEEIRGN